MFWKSIFTNRRTLKPLKTILKKRPNLFVGAQIAVGLAQLCEPFMPFFLQKIIENVQY